MDRELILKLLAQMPDHLLLNALSAGVNQIKAGSGDAARDLAGLALDDPNNKIQGWSALQMSRAPDDRPKIADKDFLVTKQQPNALPGGMPRDAGEGAYDAPGGF